MPDGDIVHPNLSARYQRVYVQLCEGYFGEEELAREAIQRVKRDIQDFGDGPIQLIGQAATRFECLATQLQQGNEINWSQERRALKDLARHVYGNKRVLELVLQACERQLHELRNEYQHKAHVVHFLLEVTKGYLLNVYNANFIGKIPLPQHYNGVDEGSVNARLDDIRPHVIRGLTYLATQIVEGKSITTLRLPRRPKGMREIDPDTDLSDFLR